MEYPLPTPESPSTTASSCMLVEFNLKSVGLAEPLDLWGYVKSTSRFLRGSPLGFRYRESHRLLGIRFLCGLKHTMGGEVIFSGSSSNSEVVMISDHPPHDQQVFSSFPCLRQFGPRQWDPRNQRPSASLLHSYANSRRSFLFIIIKKDFSISDWNDSSTEYVHLLF